MEKDGLEWTFIPQPYNLEYLDLTDVNFYRLNVDGALEACFSNRGAHMALI